MASPTRHRITMTTMFSCNGICLMVVVLLLMDNVGCQQYPGDFCTLKATGVSGQCKLITDCPAAIQALQLQKVSPQICGFQGYQSIVCCPGASPPGVSPPTPPTPNVTPPPPVPNPPPIQAPPPSTGLMRVGDKSKAKCSEYVKYIYVRAVANSPPIKDCVVQADVQLIVGGEKALAKEFPHMALVGWDDENKKKTWQCGGSLISEQYVLTAAHCVHNKQYNAEAKYVRLGELTLDTNTDEADPRDYNIIERIRHPSYKPPSQYHDIALFKLHRKAALSPYARPACLNTEPELNLNIKPRATGWGKLGYSADTSKTLLKVSLEYFTNAECNNSYVSAIGRRLKNGIVDETQVCAGSHMEAKDTCQGDSGGPLQMKHPTEECMYKIIGVTSFGKGCGVAGIPGVFTRVSNYIEWIEGIVWPS